MCGASGDMRGGSAAAATDGTAPPLGARVQAHDCRSNAARPEREEGEKKDVKKYEAVFWYRVLKFLHYCDF